MKNKLTYLYLPIFIVASAMLFIVAYYTLGEILLGGNTIYINRYIQDLQIFFFVIIAIMLISSSLFYRHAVKHVLPVLKKGAIASLVYTLVLCILFISIVYFKVFG